jgi:hypothetical protein
VPAQSIQVTNNSITCNAVHGKGYVSNRETGIWLFSQAGAQAAVEQVQGNLVNQTEGQTGIFVNGIMGSFSGQNQLRGDGNVALRVGRRTPTDPQFNDSNVLQGNEISTFKSAQHDVVFDPGTTNNLLVGHSGNCLNLGTGNKITGCDTSPVGAGQILQDSASKGADPGLTDVPTDDVTVNLNDADLADSP